LIVLPCESSARVFVDALERLNYGVEFLLGDTGIRRADLDDPDGRISCAAWARRWNCVVKNVEMRLATVTRFGAFLLIGLPDCDVPERWRRAHASCALSASR
jgi:hypothetical protein